MKKFIIESELVALRKENNQLTGLLKDSQELNVSQHKEVQTLREEWRRLIARVATLELELSRAAVGSKKDSVLKPKVP